MTDFADFDFPENGFVPPVAFGCRLFRRGGACADSSGAGVGSGVDDVGSGGDGVDSGGGAVGSGGGDVDGGGCGVGEAGSHEWPIHVSVGSVLYAHLASPVPSIVAYLTSTLPLVHAQ